MTKALCLSGSQQEIKDMTANSFSVTLPADIDVRYENIVLPKNFKGYLTRAISWTAIVPLLVLSFMQISMLSRTSQQEETRQIAFTQQVAHSFSEFLRFNALFLDSTTQLLQVHEDDQNFSDSRWLNDQLRVNPDISRLRLIYEPRDRDPADNNKSFLTRTKLVEELGSTMLCTSKEFLYKGHPAELQGCYSRQALGRLFRNAESYPPIEIELLSAKYADNKNLLSFADNGDSALLPIEPEKIFDNIQENKRIWITEGPRKDAQIVSAFQVPNSDWIIVGRQLVSLRDQILQSSLETSGALILACYFLTVIVGSVLGGKLNDNVQMLIQQVQNFSKRGHFGQIQDSFLQSAPQELQKLYEQFKNMALVVNQSQDRLRAMNFELAEKVKSRTANLKSRNQELLALSMLLAPLVDPSTVVIHKTIKRYRELLGLTYLALLKEPRDGSFYIKIKNLDSQSVGYLVADMECKKDEFKVHSLERLARSIAIVLDNEKMYSMARIGSSRFTSLLESITDGVVLVGLTGSLIYANSTARRMLDIKPNESIPKVFKHLKNIFNVYRSAQPYTGNHSERICWQSKFNSSFFMETTQFVVPEFMGYEGERKGFILRDVSDEVRTEDMKNSFISIVAHELKTPVATMRLQLETLNRQRVKGITEGFSETLSEMLEENERLQHLISNWLDLSKLHAGSMKLSIDVLPLETLLKKALREVRKRYPQLTASINIGEGSACAMGDEDRLLQVFINILENAARYNDSSSPSCKITTTRTSKCVEISFSDNGIGIPSNELEKIFDWFYQIDMSDRRKVGGVGLGLAICRGIVSAMDGRIWAENAKNGAVFKILLKNLGDDCDEATGSDN